jgi:hypothetical protein
MNTKQVRDAFDKLQWAFDHTKDWATVLLDECAAEERGHRQWGQDFAKYHPTAASVKDCARVFACKRIADALIDGPAKYPKGKEYLHCQKSWFTACGIAEEFETEIRKAWADVDLHELAALDYCDFVTAKEPKAVAA